MKFKCGGDQQWRTPNGCFPFLLSCALRHKSLHSLLPLLRSYFLPPLSLSLLKMQSTAFTLSPSLSLPNHRRLSHHTAISTLNPIPSPSHSRSIDFCAVNGVSGSSIRPFPSIRCFSSPLSSLNLNGWISTPSPVPDRELRGGVEVRAAESAGEEDAKASGLSKTLELGSLFGLWFLFNIYFNIYNKQVDSSSLSILPLFCFCFLYLAFSSLYFSLFDRIFLDVSCTSLSLCNLYGCMYTYA